MKKWEVILIILVVIFAFILGYFFSAFSHFSLVKHQREYLKQPDFHIESWMNFRVIEKNFNLSSEDIIIISGANATKVNLHMSLDSFCKFYKLNCSELVIELNGFKR